MNAGKLIEANHETTSNKTTEVLRSLARASHLHDCVTSALLVQGITIAQCSVLRVLANASGSLTITQIADMLHVSQPTMSSTVRKLSEKGLVQITKLASDRRAKQVELTEAGRASKFECEEAVAPIVQAIEASPASDEWTSMEAGLTSLGDMFVGMLSTIEGGTRPEKD